MRERPILFSAPMVRAILEGRKSQTRRAVKLPHANPLGEWEPTTFGGADARGVEHDEQAAIWHTRTGETFGCPYGVPGDRLWVRETWRVIGDNDGADYRATYVDECVAVGIPRSDAVAMDGIEPWRPSIFMPRWASRITLEVTDVSVERLQAISEADAWAEGVEHGVDHLPDQAVYAAARRLGTTFQDARPSFVALWESINGAGSWDANPWVWVVSFRRIEA